MTTKRILIIALVLSSLTTSGCVTTNNAQKGVTVGALAGGLVGSLVAGDKLVGAAVGAGVGAVAGYMVGNEMDKYDQAQLGRVAETVPTGDTKVWENPDTGRVYEATPRPAEKKDGSIYRDVIVVAEDGTKITVKVRRLANGTWEIV